METSQPADIRQVLGDIEKQEMDGWLTEHGYDSEKPLVAGEMKQFISEVATVCAERTLSARALQDYGAYAFANHRDRRPTRPLGVIESSDVPFASTCVGKGTEDPELQPWAEPYDEGFQLDKLAEIKPSMFDEVLTTPSTAGSIKGSSHDKCQGCLELVVEHCMSLMRDSRKVIDVHVEGYVTVEEAASNSNCRSAPTVEIFIGAMRVDDNSINIRQLDGLMGGRSVFDFTCSVVVAPLPLPSHRDRMISGIDIGGDPASVVILARIGNDCRPAGYCKLL